MSPWVTKLVAYPTYKPYGQQVFSSIKKISPKIPMVMMHDQNDPQLSVNDARQAYINATKAGHKRAYLMETNCGQLRHFDLKKIAALQAIYKKEGLPFTTSTRKSNQDDTLGVVDLTQMINETNIAEYQPSIKEVQTRINRSTRRKFWTRNVIDTLAFAGIAGGVYYKYFRVSDKKVS